MRYILMAVFSLLSTSFGASRQVNEFPLRPVEEKVSPGRASYPIPGSHLLRKETLEIRRYLEAHPENQIRRKVEKGAGWGFQVGDTHTWWAADFVSNDDYEVSSTCRAVGENCYIFVEDSLWEDGGNGRVTQEAVDSVRISFDLRTPADPNKGIFDTDVETFGDPPNVDSDQKIIILILNIKDGYTGTGGYVAGYFFSANEYADGDPTIGSRRSNHAEIYYVDANPLDLTTSYGLMDAMSTAAHEFQHMIHWNWDTNEGTFVNEGCSEVASVVCGYPLRNQSLYVNETNIYLFEWRGDDNTNVLNDYSRAARWTLYLHDQFPNGFLKLLVKDAANEIAGIEHALKAYTPTTQRDFYDVFEDWLVANYVDDTSVDSRYGYTFSPLAKAVPGRSHLSPNVATTKDTVERLGAQYIRFSGGSDLSVTFSSSAFGLSVKAVKMGNTTVVEDVPLGTEFTVPDFGSTFSEVTFILFDRDQGLDARYSYSATGIAQTTAMELAYDDGQPEGYLLLSTGDSILVYFDGVGGTRLDSLRIAFRRAGTIQMGIWEFTGSVDPSPFGQTLVAPFDVVSPDSVSSVPYPDPYDNWVTVDLTSHEVDASSDFAVSFLIGSNPRAPAVMISSEPDDGDYHSFTYSQSRNRWIVYSDANNPSNVFKYVVRAYVSSPPAQSKESVELLPDRFALFQNFPNPFNPATTIRYTIPEQSLVTIDIYNILGQHVTRLLEETQVPGSYRLRWDSSGQDEKIVTAGIYFVRIEAGGEIRVRKMTLLK